MSDVSPHLELLWRHLDGEPLDASDLATLEGALAADPVLRQKADLHSQTRSLVRALPSESASAALAAAISKGIATPPLVAKVVLFGLPIQRFALVAALLLAVLAGVYSLRPEPISHETALMQEHLAAVQAQTTFQPLLASVTADPDWVEMRGLQLPGGSVTLVGQRDCVIIDCPATQFFGTHWNGTPLSIFVVDHNAHFELGGYVVAAGGTPQHDYGVMRIDGATMVAWKQQGRLFGLVANVSAGDLIALAEQSRTSLVSFPAIMQLASLRGHTIH